MANRLVLIRCREARLVFQPFWDYKEVGQVSQRPLIYGHHTLHAEETNHVHSSMEETLNSIGIEYSLVRPTPIACCRQQTEYAGTEQGAARKDGSRSRKARRVLAIGPVLCGLPSRDGEQSR
jgi:hypothetical protein